MSFQQCISFSKSHPAEKPPSLSVSQGNLHLCLFLRLFYAHATITANSVRRRLSTSSRHHSLARVDNSRSLDLGLPADRFTVLVVFTLHFGLFEVLLCLRFILTPQVTQFQPVSGRLRQPSLHPSGSFWLSAIARPSSQHAYVSICGATHAALALTPILTFVTAHLVE